MNNVFNSCRHLGGANRGLYINECMEREESCVSSYSLCGADCEKCPFEDGCGGCAATNGRPFGEECIIVSCTENGADAEIVIFSHI